MSIAEPGDLTVITGASSGIGAVYADRLAAEGRALLLVARRPDRLEQVATEVSYRHGVSVETMVVDLEQPQDLARLEARLERERVAMLVNNAGGGSLGPTARSTADRLERLIRLNIVALTRLSVAALSGFRERSGGTLVNLGSIVAHAPSAGAAVYTGTKGYVANFTRSLQLEYADSAIRIQLVMPGPIRTEFFSSQGMSDSVFPDSSFLTAEQLVDAALAGLAAGEAVTSPSMPAPEIWDALETARQQYLSSTFSGQVAPRYRSAAPAAPAQRRPSILRILDDLSS
ncbi:SDR family oxidoreductase [Phenylobacterium sp. Root700]|uniref:SDR family NAD(P)-dependent oxidoreductase n=1 Tax=Phenylobacterium sp. Root700 TaxID=1736591 RepID=UPI0009E6C952|nr:SDR family NAD(P)-dependent oxidoreductase [Phenylobacterium sp. Root700]